MASTFKELREELNKKTTRNSARESRKVDAYQLWDKSKLGLDTFESDLRTIGDTINGIYNGWQTQETMQNTRTAVEKMHQKIGDIQSYQNKYGSLGIDTESLASGYQSVLDDWDNLSSVYGYYQNADAFNTAKKKSQMDNTFSGLSYDEVQAKKNEYEEDSDEYKYLSGYTGYKDLRDFDKAIESLTEDGDYKKQLQTARNQHALDNTFGLYKDYMDAEDFEETSQYVSTKSDGVWDKLTSQYGMGYEDLTYEFINDVDGMRSKIKNKANVYGKDSGDGISSMEKKGYDKLNEDERKVYNTIYKTEGKKKAQEFLDAMEVTLTKRVYDEDTQRWEDVADSGAVASTLMSALTVPANMMGAITGTIESVGDAIQGKEYNPYGYYKTPSNFYADTREYVGENIAEKTEGMELFGQNIPSFLYQTGMSMADSTAGALTFGSAFAPIMGMSASQQKAKELKEAGASDEEIARGAVASGTFEMLFEKLSLDNLFSIKNADSFGKIVKETLKQAGIEGSEEMFTEIANVGWDYMNRQDASDIMQKYEDYLERGFSESEAKKKTTLDITGQVAWAGIGGALSGMGMGGASSIANNRNLANTGKQIRANDRTNEMVGLFDTMEMQGLTPEQSEAYKLYGEYLNKGDIDSISNAKLGNLYQTSYRETDNTLRSKKATDAQKTDAANRLYKLNEIATSKPVDERARQKRVEELNKGEVTEVTATGNSTKIDGIRIEDGSTIVLTSEGEVKAEDMTFSSNDAEILSYAEVMGTEKGNLFISQYDGKQDVSDYQKSFNLAYAYGEAGVGADNVLANKGVLTEAQASEIYKNAVTIKANAKQKAIDEINAKYASKHVVAGKFDDSIIDYKNKGGASKVNWNSLTSKQRRAVTFAKAFSKATGVNIRFVKSDVVKGTHVGKNGSYNPDTNTIDIDVYAGRMDARALNDSIIPTMSHEITHWMKAKTPAIFSKMQETVMNTLALSDGMSMDDRITYEMARMKKNHPDMEVTAEMAVDEIMARACEDMLSNSKTARELLEGLTEKERKSFIDKVKETYQNLIDWVNHLLSEYESESEEAQILRQFEDKLEEISKMWDQALADAIKTNQNLQAEGKTAEVVINETLESIGLHFDAESETVYSYRSLEDAFNMNDAEDFIRTKDEYIEALHKATGRSKKTCENYLNSLFLVHDLIGNDRARLDYEAAVDKSSWVSNSEYGGSIDFSTLCAKRRLFTGTMDAIIEKMPNTVLTDTDFLDIRNRLLAKELEAPCSMCYVEGSRAKNSIYINNWLTEYKKTNPKWIPQLADFTSTVRLEKTRLNHPEAYKAYQDAMNKLAQRKPKEASVRTDYKGEIRVAFADGTSVDIKNKNGGIRFNSFSDFEIIHALDCMQVVTDMATVGLAGQGYTKVKEFAECFGNTGMKINLSLVAKGVDENGNLIFDEVNGMKYEDAMSLRNRYSKNVGTVIVVFNHDQLRAALRDNTIDYVLPFHRSQWRKAQYVMMGLPTETRDYTMEQNDRITNPKTGKPVKLAKLKHVTTYTNDITGEAFEIKDNIMPNQYWDYNADGVTNARRYLDYINANKMTPKFAFLLTKDANGKWILPVDANGNVTAEGKGYFKTLIDFKMYDNDGVGSPQTPVVPDFNMSYINDMLNNYIGGHESFPVAHDVADAFVKDYKKAHSKEQYADRDSDYVDSRTLLTNALETVAQTDTEKELLTEYRKDIDILGIKESELSEIKAEIKELSFGSGNRDTQRLEYLKKRAEKLQNSINWYDKKLLNMEAAAPLKAVVDRERAKAKKKAYEKNREYTKQYMTSYKEAMEKRAKIESITQKALVLSKWMLKNSKDEHIPEAMKPVVAHLLKAIDFSSKQLLGMRGGQYKGMPTQKDISIAKALREVQQLMSEAKVDGEVLYELYGADLDNDMKELIEKVDLYASVVGDNAYVLNQMTLDDLHKFDKIVGAIKSSVTKMNQFHVVNHKKGIVHLGQQTINDMAELGQAKLHNNKFAQSVSQMMNWGNTTPYYAFKRFGEGGVKVYEALMEGWDKFAFHIKKIIDYSETTYTSEDVKKWSDEVKTFNGIDTEIQITVPQIMSLYCLQKREQAMGHILKGGIRVSDIETKGGVISQSDGAMISETLLKNIIGSLTEEQIRVADALQKFMNEDCAEWGNEISMKRFGYKAFGEANYFPIRSDENVTGEDTPKEEQKSLYRLLNMSFTKALTENANNRIIVEDIFDVFAQHTSEMAKYNALALPVLDAVRWFNYKEKVKKEEGRFKTYTVKQAMEKAFGQDAKNYVNTFLKDINGADNVGRDRLAKGFMSNAKIASVGFNAKVVALQPTSYLRASAVIDNKYLVQAFSKKPKIAMAEKWCGMAQWKALGFIDINVQRGVADLIKHDESFKDKATEWSMKGAEMADKVTMGYLWNACEAEVKATRSDLTARTDEYYTAVGKRLREVIYATQVVDSTMTRSHMMRSSDNWDKILTNFSSEPTLSYNMLMDVYYDYNLSKRKGESIAFNKHGKKLARTLYAYTITNAITALLELGFEAFRDDEEKEPEELMKMYLENLYLNTSIINKIPYAKEAISLLQGFSSSRMDTQWMQYFAYTAKGIVKLLNGEGNAYTTAKNGIKAFSYLSGMPFFNLWRDANALLDKADILTSEDLEEMYNDTIGSIFPSQKIK